MLVHLTFSCFNNLLICMELIRIQLMKDDNDLLMNVSYFECLSVVEKDFADIVCGYVEFTLALAPA